MKEEVWDLKNFDTPHLPKMIGFVKLKSCRRVLDLPIKLADQSVCQVPDDLQFTKNFVNLALYDAWKKVGNESFNAKYIYLTVDTSLVLPNTSQRNSGCHVDGFQGVRISSKVVPDFSYIAYSCCPTEFFMDCFHCSHWDPAKVDFFKSFDALAKTSVAFPSGSVLFTDAYTVHRAGRNITRNPLKRTFYRLLFSVRQYDRLGNTHNPLLNYKWEMVPRPKPNLPAWS